MYVVGSYTKEGHIYGTLIPFYIFFWLGRLFICDKNGHFMWHIDFFFVFMCPLSSVLSFSLYYISGFFFIVFHFFPGQF